ncbi:MAG: NAD(P)/FAD-dependent oxidoreductase [Gammaproteobacteria bacterium]|nr:MAG: NAD(P)/FAD-dependent oxidoreductase [Gammaproteobacteria bacterium]
MADMNTDVLIIGAGPAGTSAASLLHQAGYKALIIESQKFPRFVIGESLLPRSMDLLDEAGMLEAVHKRNYMVKNGAVFLRGDQACTINFGEQFTNGWKYTYQVPRDDFDKVLADVVEAKGIEILWEHKVTDVRFTDTGPETVIQDKDGKTISISSRFILDGSGYGRVLPRLLDLNLPSKLAIRDSIFTHVTGDKRPQGSEEGQIWICVLPGNAWLWIIPFSNGKTSIGVVAKPDFIDSFPGELDEKLRAIIDSEPNARKRLGDTKFVFPTERIHSYSISVKRLCGKYYALMGNATEFLDPVFSSGVTLALESANRAAKTLIRQLNGEQVDWDKEYAEYLMQGVDTFRTFVNAWYEDKLSTIFFCPVHPEGVKSQVCSVLAGYVWDKDNPCVEQHERAVNALAELCAQQTA